MSRFLYKPRPYNCGGFISRGTSSINDEMSSSVNEPVRTKIFITQPKILRNYAGSAKDKLHCTYNCALKLEYFMMIEDLWRYTDFLFRMTGRLG